ncbi:p21 protein (Cdc42 Rac)-activated kinase [Parelaphostrongylus tenuis]|uniref:non-specific serine/threonine protein kinase n=1 Tax=Parelaphostrongylus tenuis TaxID=148309 RepID=A0AAD5WEL8_PARTN|nr:p21 protein (Cdc42 Rac)-activated kinase [Parelaphostrongylus tenuis]
MRGVVSSYDDKPPPPPLRFSSGSGSGKEQSVVGLKPLPKEPLDSGKKKKSMTNPFVKKNREKKDTPEKPVISEPSNFEHTVHVGYDPATGEFTGMPSAWARLLMESQISKQEQQQNPQAVLDALKYYTQGENGSQQKWLQYDMNDCSPRPSTGASIGLKTGYSTSSLPHHYSNTNQFYTHTAQPVFSGSNIELKSSQKQLASPPKSSSNSIKPSMTQEYAAVNDNRTSMPPSYAPPPVPEDEDPADCVPPPIPDRPARTLSIYTKPKDEEERIPDLSQGQFGVQSRGVAKGKRKMTDAEVLTKLRSIVTIGNPDKKYRKIDKIGSGASGSVYTAMEMSTGAEVAIKQMNLKDQPKKRAYHQRNSCYA